MKKFLVLTLITLSTSMFADPGIMLDADIIIHGPTGTGQVEMGCR